MEDHKVTTVIISFSDILSCPFHILAPSHWIGGHHVEECDPELRATLKAYDERLAERKRELAQRLERYTQNERALFILGLRGGGTD